MASGIKVRQVGPGLPMLVQAAENAGGSFRVVVKITFRFRHRAVPLSREALKNLYRLNPHG